MNINHEQRLIKEIRQGRKEAFAELVEPCIAKAYRMALAILRSSHLAEEAVQNTLIEVYRTIMTGKEIHRFYGWFSRVIANRAMDLVRKESRHGGGVDIDTVTVQDKSASPIEELLKKEQSSQVLDAVMSLEVKYRIVIVLYYFEELKIDEIAEELGVTPGTIKTRLHRARLSLNRLVSFPELQEKVIPL